MSNRRRAWVLGASVAILAVGVAAAASPRRAQGLAPARDARSAAASSRPAGQTPVVAPVSETPRPAPAPPPRVRRSSRSQPAPSSSVTAVLEDPPAPEPLPPMWEDLFPVRPGAAASSASTTRCFDQLQGIGGISPCSATITRALGH